MAGDTAIEQLFDTGDFAPVKKEVTEFDLPFEGEIPSALNGRYLRNGPNPDPVPAGGHHWFFGDGMLHGIELREGKAVWYRNRWIQTDMFNASHDLEPPAGPAETHPVGNPANTNVVYHAGKILALCEVGLPYVISPELETVGKYDFDGKLTGAMTAHPHTDPATGEMFFFGYWFVEPYLRYHHVSADGLLLRSEEITVKGPTMIHDFAITENYAIFFDLPVVFDMNLAASGTMPYKWDPSYGARVGVMPREGGDADVKWFEVEPCYVFHQLNAYESGDQVIVDVARYASMWDLDSDAVFSDDGAPTLHRWTFDLSSGVANEETLLEQGFEFPRVDPRVAGRRSRYGYGSALRPSDDESIQFGNLIKFDQTTGATEIHDLGDGVGAGEGVFAPASDSAGEDEGWIIAITYDESRDASDLIIIDSTDFAGKATAKVHLPQRVPWGFHGNWMPS